MSKPRITEAELGKIETTYAGRDDDEDRSNLIAEVRRLRDLIHQAHSPHSRSGHRVATRELIAEADAIRGEPKS